MSSTPKSIAFIGLKISAVLGLLFLLVLPFVADRPAFDVTDKPDPTVKVEPAKPAVKVETYVQKHSVILPDFAKIRDVKTKKERFFKFMTPFVNAENIRLTNQHYWLQGLKAQLAGGTELSEATQLTLQKLYKSYRIKHLTMSSEAALNELLKCVDGLPKSLVLMQAANESAWGTSRFARLGLNFFGQWCYTKDCGIVPNGRGAGRKYEVQAFLTVAQSVDSYFKNINTNSAYSLLREIRAQLRENNIPLQADILATGLLRYSQRGDHYVVEITKMINYNQRFLGD